MTVQSVICTEVLKVVEPLKFKGSPAQVEFAHNMAVYCVTRDAMMIASRGGEWDKEIEKRISLIRANYKTRGGIDSGKFLETHASASTLFKKGMDAGEAVRRFYGERLNASILDAV